MNELKSSEYISSDPIQFHAQIRAVHNGFIFSVNGQDYVIQGIGDKQADFDSLLNALESAYQKVAY